MTIAPLYLVTRESVAARLETLQAEADAKFAEAESAQAHADDLYAEAGHCQHHVDCLQKQLKGLA